HRPLPSFPTRRSSDLATSYATLYWLIDVTLISKDHANAAGQRLTSPQVAWFSGNRWGMTGVHQLAGHDGLKAIFKLESEFESETDRKSTRLNSSHVAI